LDGLIPAIGPRPMDLLKLKGATRQRAARKKKQEAESWQWGDDS
jgi:hypothetical protein